MAARANLLIGSGVLPKTWSIWYESPRAPQGTEPTAEPQISSFPSLVSPLEPSSQVNSCATEKPTPEAVCEGTEGPDSSVELSTAESPSVDVSESPVGYSQNSWVYNLPPANSDTSRSPTTRRLWAYQTETRESVESVYISYDDPWPRNEGEWIQVDEWPDLDPVLAAELGPFGIGNLELHVAN
jgi:hypothetical protein